MIFGLVVLKQITANSHFSAGTGYVSSNCGRPYIDQVSSLTSSLGSMVSSLTSSLGCLGCFHLLSSYDALKKYATDHEAVIQDVLVYPLGGDLGRVTAKCVNRELNHSYFIFRLFKNRQSTSL